MVPALEGHILAGRLKEDDKKLVRDLTKSKVQPRHILIHLKNNRPHCMTNVKHGYNERAQIWKANRGDKKPLQFMIRPTNSLDDLKAQLNAYFVHIGENQRTRHLFGQMPCIDLGEDRDEYTWKMASYIPWLIEDDGDIGFMFPNMVENNILYMYVRSICNCYECVV